MASKLLKILIFLTALLLAWQTQEAQAARLWSAGFELATAADGAEFDVSCNSAGTIVSNIKRSGDYAGRITGMTSAQLKCFYETFATVDQNGPLYVRTYLRVATAPSANNRIVMLEQLSDTDLAWINLTSSRTLTLNDATSQVGSASSALATGRWYRLEILFDATGAGATDTLRARLDGVEFAGASDRTLTAGAGQVVFGANLGAEAQTAGDWYFDDIAVNDATGSNQTSYPGAGNIVHLHPNANGDKASGSINGPSCGAGWCTVDEVTPRDLSENPTDVYVLDVNNDILDVNIQDAPTVGLNGASTITLLQVGSRTSGGTGAQRSHSLRIKSQSEGTVATGTAITISSVSWLTNAAPDIVNTELNYTLTSYTDPQDGSAWTFNEINSAQIGASCTDAAPDCWIGTLWVLVEYVPSTNAHVKSRRGVKLRRGIKFRLEQVLWQMLKSQYLYKKEEEF